MVVEKTLAHELVAVHRRLCPMGEEEAEREVRGCACSPRCIDWLNLSISTW